MPARVGGKRKRAKKKTLYYLQYGQCNICDCSIKMDECTVDHIIPLSEGGGNANENLQLLCHSCHSEKTRNEHKKYRQKRKANSVKSVCVSI